MVVPLVHDPQVRLGPWQQEAQRRQCNRCRRLHTRGRTAVPTEEAGRGGRMGDRESRRCTLGEKQRTYAEHEDSQAPAAASDSQNHRHPCASGMGHAIIGDCVGNGGTDAATAPGCLGRSSNPRRKIATTVLAVQAR